MSRLVKDFIEVRDCGSLDALIESRPDLYYKPPYLGPSGWIAIRTDAAATDWDHIGDRVAQSWEMVAPRRLLEMGGR